MQIGDKVRVKQFINDVNSCYIKIGDEGVIAREAPKYADYDWTVNFADHDCPENSDDFYESELELVEDISVSFTYISSYKVGDKVKIVSAPFNPILVGQLGSVLSVDFKWPMHKIALDDPSLTSQGFVYLHSYEMELYEEPMTPKFEVGDKVVIINSPSLKIYNKYIDCTGFVSDSFRTARENFGYRVEIIGLKNFSPLFFWESELELTPKTNLELIQQEHDSAVAKNDGFNSLHEAYAVILEEMDELWDEIKLKPSERNMKNLKKEAVQVGAMILRLLNEFPE